MADVTTAQIKARVRLIRNGTVLYDETYDSGKDNFTEYTQQRFVLAAASGSQQVDLSGVASGKKLLVTTDRVILVAVNDATYQVPVESVLLLESSGITGVWVENEDATFTANVTLAVTD